MKSLYLLALFAIVFSHATAQPTYVWANGLGSGSNSFSYAGRAITTDKSGNVYVVGDFHLTTDFNPGAGVDNLSASAYSDIFIGKYNGNGDYQWAKSIADLGYAYGNDVAVDDSGNVYITGSTSPAYGNTGYFTVVKYDAAGNLKWQKTGTSNGYGTGIRIDAAGNIIAAGYENVGGLATSYFKKYNSGGALIWGKAITGTRVGYGNPVVKDLTTGNNNYIYLTGYFADTIDVDPGAGVSYLSGVSGSSKNLLLAAYDATGALLWAKNVGDSNADVESNTIGLDGDNNIYVAGSFSSSLFSFPVSVDFNPGSGSAILTTVGGKDIFVARYTSTGNYLRAMSMGSADDDVAYSLAIDKSNDMYLTGTFRTSVNFNPAGSNLVASYGSDDMFFARYDSAFNYHWATHIGGFGGTELSLGIAVDNKGSFYVSGVMTNQIMDVSPGADTLVMSVGFSSVYGIFFAKYGDKIATAAANKNADPVLIYPNPASETLYISGAQPGDIEVRDLLGNLVMRSTTAGQTALRVHTLPAGLYLLRLKNAAGEPVTVHRFVKE